MRRSALFLVFFCCTIFYSTAQFVKLHDFTGAVTGSNPYGSLVLVDSFLYGVTDAGGTANYGVVFKIKPDGTGAASIHDFDGTNGSAPMGDLIYDGTYLYGTTSSGGSSGNGTIFRIKPSGNSFAKIFDFNGTTGGGPRGSLLSDGTFFYGLTFSGGSGLSGVMFKVKPDGSAYAVMHNFSFPTGVTPSGSVIAVGSYFYGMTMQSGAGNNGTIFRIKPDGTSFFTVLDFTGVANGGSPRGSLVYDGTYLYGTTQYGGTNNNGVIFKMLPDGTGFSKLHDFGPGTGIGPTGNIVVIGGTIYALASGGGANSNGTLVKIKSDGTNFYKMLDFDNVPNGKSPHGTLTSDGNFLYGMTFEGGANNFGTVFKYPVCTQLAATIQADTICTGQVITIGNHTYTTAGTYSDTTISSAGCVTAFTLQLQVQSIDLTVAVHYDTLFANQSNAAYQWIDCSTTTPIPGATNQQFIANQTGNYAVIITKGCTDTSICVSAIPNGIDAITSTPQSSVTVFPNPANAVLNINCEKTGAALCVYNMMGQVVFTTKLGYKNTIDISSWPQGVYTLEIKSGDTSLYRKVVVSQD